MVGTSSSRIQVLEDVLVHSAKTNSNDDVGNDGTVCDDARTMVIRTEAAYLYDFENGECTSFDVAVAALII